MNTIKSLLLVWKDKESGLYYHVGTLTFDGEEYTFEYSFKSRSTRNVNIAIKEGYTLHPAFPYLEKTYKSHNLFEAFNRRVPDKNRVEFDGFKLEFELRHNSDRMDILCATRGALANDPYTFEEPLQLQSESVFTTFFINGMRHQNLQKDWTSEVTKGDFLKTVLDEQNVNDPFAVKVETLRGVTLGFVPAIYSQAIHALLKRGVNIQMCVLKVRPHFAPQWWLQVSLTAELNGEDKATLEESSLKYLVQKTSA